MTSEEDPLARYERRLRLDRMPTGVELCRYFKIPSQGPRTPQVDRHARDHHAGGITTETCPHAANDHRGNGSAYYAQCSACRIHIEYYPKDQPEVKMAMEGIRLLASERRRKTLSAEERETLRQACTTLKTPPSVAGFWSSAGNGGPHDPAPRPSEAASGSRRVAPPTEEEVRLNGFLNLGLSPLTFTIDHCVAGNGRRSKAQGPRQQATPGRDVPDENGTSWVIVQDDGQEDTERPTDDARAEATNSQATSDVRFCDICPRFCEICARCLNGDEQHKHHMKLHRAQNQLHLECNGGAALGPELEEETSGRDVPYETETARGPKCEEDTEISTGAFKSMVAWARDPGASDQTVEILTVLAGLLHKELPEDFLRIREGSSS